VFVYGLLYINLLERELAPQPTALEDSES